MSLRPVLRRAVVLLGATGSLAPGMWAAPEVVVRAPPARPAATALPAVVGPVAVDPAWRRTWSWPMSPRSRVLAPFVAPRSAYGAGHRGIDLGARQGQEVRAVAAGVVTHVGVVAGRGTVSVTHATGLRSTYEPVRASVTTGAVVGGGDALGEVSGRSHCGGACLHLGALVGGAYVDPRPLLGGGPVILLPLLGGR